METSVVYGPFLISKPASQGPVQIRRRFIGCISDGNYVEKDSERHIQTVFLTQSRESVLWQMTNGRMFNDSCADAGKADSELAPQGEADDIGTFTAFDKVSNHLRRKCPVIAE